MQPTQSAMTSTVQRSPNPIAPANPSFREATRIQQSFLANMEKRTLIWLAARTPAWDLNSDHLTVLGLLLHGSSRCQPTGGQQPTVLG